jgi:tRNA (guanosine-2'-O-)-methyltransferase
LPKRTPSSPSPDAAPDDATHPQRPAAADPDCERRLAVLERYLTPARQRRLEHALTHRRRHIAAVVDGIHDLGNAAAIMRTCDGLGVHDVFIIDRAPRYRAARRTTQGSHKWLDIHRFPDPAACVADLRARGYVLAGAALDARSVPLSDLDLSQPLAVTFGNEKDGLSPAMLAACDVLFHIPMLGLSQSLNVSVAAAIALYDLQRRLTDLRGPNGDLPPDDLEALRELFYRKAVQSADAILTRELGQPPPPLLQPTDGITAALDAIDDAALAADALADPPDTP